MKKTLINILIGLLLLFVLGSPTIRSRNVIRVLANANDQLIFEAELMELSKLSDTLKIWIDNKENNQLLAEKKITKIEYFGEIPVSKAVVSIATDKGTTYNFYIQVQNEIERAYNELRNELALQHFNTPYENLSDSKRKAINKVYPKRISEAEPND